jgi:hypothetical protein
MALSWVRVESRFGFPLGGSESPLGESGIPFRSPLVGGDSPLGKSGMLSLYNAKVLVSCGVLSGGGRMWSRGTRVLS